MLDIPARADRRRFCDRLSVMSDAKSLSSQARTPANRPLFLIDFVLSDPVETAFDLKQEALTTATTYYYHYY